MRIAVLAPLYEPVPPPCYGGTERVVSYLVDELVRRGHDVSLFASGESRTTARLVPVRECALNDSPAVTDPIAYHVLQLGMVLTRAESFDLIHSHCDFRALPFSELCPVPILTTNHNRLDAPENVDLSARYPSAPLSALSNSQMQQLPWARWLGVCYNGVPVETYPFCERPGSYLAFVGRLSPEKGPDVAITIAEKTGMPLKLAGKINSWEREYFDSAIRPRLVGPSVEYVGELDEAAKRDFLANAFALLFPIDWPEPFGMVMIEAMASGTPVLAFPYGAAPEIVDDGVTGFVCRDAASMVARVGSIDELDRANCRRRVAERFSDQLMTDAYEACYGVLLNKCCPRER
jgi:glycosyltransferase involved in cell wall biosynthesis